MKKNKSILLSTPYLIWMVVFTLIPLGVVCYYALTDPSTGEFSLVNLRGLNLYWGVLWQSIFYAVASAFICLLLGKAKVFRGHHQFFPHCGAENLVVGVLKHIAAAARHLGHRFSCGVFPHQVHFALCGPQQAVEMAHQGGFATAVLPHDGYDIALVDIQVNPLQGLDVPTRVNMHQLFHANYSFCHLHTPPWPSGANTETASLRVTGRSGVSPNRPRSASAASVT